MAEANVKFASLSSLACTGSFFRPQTSLSLSISSAVALRNLHGFAKWRSRAMNADTDSPSSRTARLNWYLATIADCSGSKCSSKICTMSLKFTELTVAGAIKSSNKLNVLTPTALRKNGTSTHNFFFPNTVGDEILLNPACVCAETLQTRIKTLVCVQCPPYLLRQRLTTTRRCSICVTRVSGSLPAPGSELLVATVRHTVVRSVLLYAAFRDRHQTPQGGSPWAAPGTPPG